MLKIRLMRIGAKGQPFYRVVAVDERKKSSGAYLELLGTYNPLTEPKQIILKQDRIDDWVKKGAVLSDGFLRIIGKAPQRQPRKPKKDKQPSAISPQPAVEESKPAEETTPEQPTEPATEEVKVEASETPQVEEVKSDEPVVETEHEPEKKEDAPKEEATPAIEEEVKE